MRGVRGFRTIKYSVFLPTGPSKRKARSPQSKMGSGKSTGVRSDFSARGRLFSALSVTPIDSSMFPKARFSKVSRMDVLLSCVWYTSAPCSIICLNHT